jgi:hypothetical protein
MNGVACILNAIDGSLGGGAVNRFTSLHERLQNNRNVFCFSSAK